MLVFQLPFQPDMNFQCRRKYCEWFGSVPFSQVTSDIWMFEKLFLLEVLPSDGRLVPLQRALPEQRLECVPSMGQGALLTDIWHLFGVLRRLFSLRVWYTVPGVNCIVCLVPLTGSLNISLPKERELVLFFFFRKKVLERSF